MRLYVAFLACALLTAPAAHAQTPVSVEAFGRLPAVADAAISPDGRRVALASTTADGESTVIVADLANPAQRQVFGVGGGMQLRSVGWADAGRVTYLVSQTFHANSVLPSGFRWRGGSPGRVDYFRNGVINLTTGRAITLTTNPDNPWADYGSLLVTPIADDPGYGRIVGSSANTENRQLVVFRVALDSGRVWQDAPNGVNQETYNYLINDRGQVAARFDSNRRTNRWRIFIYDGETPRLLFEDVSEYGAAIDLVGLLPDGRLVAQDANDAGFYGLFAINQATGAGETLFARQGVDIDGAIVDPWTRQVVGVAWTETEAQQQFFDADLEAIRQALAAALPGAAFRLESWSQDRRRALVYVERELDGGTYYWYETGGQLRALAARYPDLRRSEVGQRQSISYRARDGQSIPAYLTLPSSVEGRNLPVVVLVHGGPHARDTMDFDWWSSFLASRGYAVLQPNFRGSSGYGQAWEDAGRRQWGGVMQTDVEDGVAALVRSGVADAGRICIVGASYGGFAALAGATLTPDRYECAVSVAGVSDLGEFLQVRERQTSSDSFTADWWRASIGDRNTDRDSIRAVSPALLADRVRIPILLLHGTDDTVVPIDQSRRMERALRGAGKQVRFVELRGDDHWLSDAPTRIQMLREIETFLAEHLSPAPTAAPP